MFFRRKRRDKFKDDSDERKLLRTLLSNYDIEGRPVRVMNTTTSVGFGLGLIQMDLNEKDKVLTLSMWSRYVSIQLRHRHGFPSPSSNH